MQREYNPKDYIMPKTAECEEDSGVILNLRLNNLKDIVANLCKVFKVTYQNNPVLSLQEIRNQTEKFHHCIPKQLRLQVDPRYQIRNRNLERRMHKVNNWAPAQTSEVLYQRGKINDALIAESNLRDFTYLDLINQLNLYYNNYEYRNEHKESLRKRIEIIFIKALEVDAETMNILAKLNDDFFYGSNAPELKWIKKYKIQGGSVWIGSFYGGLYLNFAVVKKGNEQRFFVGKDIQWQYNQESIEEDNEDSEFFFLNEFHHKTNYLELKLFEDISKDLKKYFKQEIDKTIETSLESKSEFLGEKEQRFSFKAKLISAKYFTQKDQFGVHKKCALSFGDENKNILVSFTTHDNGKKIEEGFANQDEYKKLAGRIQGHQEYQGVRQTILTRVTLGKK